MSSDRKRHRDDAPATAERSSQRPRRARLVQFLSDPSMRRTLESLGFRFSIDNSNDALVDVDGLISALQKHGRTADGATFLWKPAVDREMTKWKTQVEDVTAKLQAAAANARTLEHEVQTFRRHQDPKELTEAVHRAARLERELEAMKRVKNEVETKLESEKSRLRATCCSLETTVKDRDRVMQEKTAAWTQEKEALQTEVSSLKSECHGLTQQHADDEGKIERLVEAGKATRHLLEAIHTVVKRNKRSL